MSALSVQLFGHFSATLDGAVLPLNTTRLQSLFACLLLRPHAHFRYHLAYQFWPQSSEAQARTNLRNLVHLLRQALPDFDSFIQSDAQTLQWRPGAPCRLDVNEFEQLLAFPPHSGPSRARLEQAAALYKGDLLPDCYDEWILAERERLRRACLSALEALAEIAENERDYPAALQAARRLLQEEPLHTAANRQLIRLLALTGSQPAALKAYQAYAALLKDELGIAPEPETRTLAEQIHLSLENPQPVEPEALALVGRQSEWGLLQSAWRHAARGSPQALFITGEAGIGKTRLVNELLDWTSRQGVRIGLANCYPAEGGLPYAPVVSWLRARPLPRLEKIWLGELARLLPELHQANPKLARPAPITEAWQRQRLFEALARAVLGEVQAQLLVLEDIHWCDQDTLEWLHYLLRYDRRAPLLLVATERSEEVAAPGQPLKKLQSALAAEDRLTQVQLKALNEAESLRLAGQVAERGFHPALRPEFAAHIFAETEGNPLFIVEMVRLGSPARSWEQASFSARVQAVLKERIDQLSQPTGELASLAATLGRQFRLDVLRQASGLAEAELVKALDELLQRQILHELAPDRYDFTHDKLRQALFSGLSSAHRRLLHRQAAEAYLALAGESAQLPGAEIARHYESAGLAGPAIQYYRRAAEAAASLFSTGEAIRNLERAIQLAAADGAGVTPAELAELQETLAGLLAQDGCYPQALACYEQALARPASLPGLWRARVYRKLSDVLAALYQHSQAHAALDQAEAACSGEAPAEKQEQLQIQLARIQLFYWENQPLRMEEFIRRVGPLVEAEGTPEQRMTLIQVQSEALLRKERFRVSPETVQFSRRRLELVSAAGDSAALAITQFQVGFVLMWAGDLAAASELMTSAYAGNTRLGARIWQIRTLAYLGVVHRKLEDLPALRAATQQLELLLQTLDEPTYHGINLANQGWLAWREGRPARARQLCLEARAGWDKFGGDAFHGLADWVLLALAVEQGDLPGAQACAADLLDPNPSFQPLLPPAAALLGQALAACQAGAPSAALALFGQALAEARAEKEL